MKLNFARALVATAGLIASTAAFAQTSGVYRMDRLDGAPVGAMNNGGPSTSQNARTEATGGAQGGLAETTGSIAPYDNSVREMQVERTERYRR